MAFRVVFRSLDPSVEPEPPKVFAAASYDMAEGGTACHFVDAEGLLIERILAERIKGLEVVRGEGSGSRSR